MVSSKLTNSYKTALLKTRRTSSFNNDAAMYCMCIPEDSVLWYTMLLTCCPAQEKLRSLGSGKPTASGPVWGAPGPGGWCEIRGSFSLRFSSAVLWKCNPARQERGATVSVKKTEQ